MVGVKVRVSKFSRLSNRSQLENIQRGKYSTLNGLTHGGMVKEDSLSDERLWMYMTMTDEASDAAHKSIMERKYISAQKRIYFAVCFRKQ